MDTKDILKDVDAYYTEKIKQFGATPRGVDWNSVESQQMRFKQLLDVVPDKSASFTLLDYGCGFGSMYEFMQPEYPNMKFIGLDISASMIESAKEKFGNTNAQWFTQLPDGFTCDYVVASGIFNVRMGHSEEEWKKYIIETLIKINAAATKGFSFNVLTKYSDKEYMKDYLHYADPAFLFDYCKTNFSKYVALKHDYPLYEFTMVVRKPS